MAHDDSSVSWIHRNVASVEEAVEVASHYETVRNFMPLVQVKRSNISGVEDRQGPLSR